VSFTGFPAAAVSFYEALENDNSKPFWEAHKAAWESDVRDPMLALLDELEPEFGSGKTFRPYRDVRFSKDKTPYKNHQGGFVERLPGTGLYVQVSADGLLVAGGFHSHASDQVERFRAAVAGDAGDELAKLVDELRAAGYRVGGEQLKTRPRGYPADHPRIELLRHRNLVAERHWPPAAWLSTPEALERVRDAWRAFGPLCDWIGEHVGAAREAADR
jgi:uncharacterized protein (TIGR02453 family)